MNMKVLIIEDEQLNTNRLVRLLQQLKPEWTILEPIETVAGAVNWLYNNPMPDLLLMDIRLSDGLSFEILEAVEVNVPIIFTTAYDEYAIKAFKFNSIDYLLKPIDSDELQHALDKVARLENSTISTLHLDNLKDLFAVKEYRNRFLLPFRDGYRTLLVNEIAFLYTENRITYAQLCNDTQSVVLPQTLEELEQQLDPKQFFRANRQYIIHIDSIQHIFNHFNGKLKVELKRFPTTEILISREKAGAFKQWLDK